MSPLLIHTRHFPPHKYHAISIFPFVFYNGQPLTNNEIQHETIHLWQQIALLIIPFYMLYLTFWLIGLARYRNFDMAYRSIPFERSAYMLESKSYPKAFTQAFHWIKMVSYKEKLQQRPKA